MLSELEILEKHLGKANTDMMAMKNHTQKFVEDITDANDFIAVLQLINKALKRILALEENKDFNDLQNKVLISNECLQIVENCAYMNTALFDNTYLVNVGSKDFSFEIANPLKILENNDYKDMFAYTADKLDESKELLSRLGMAIMGFGPKNSFGDINATESIVAYKGLSK